MDNNKFDMESTMLNVNIRKDKSKEIREVMDLVCEALKERGYNPINQIVGYILSGDPTYVTSHNNVRTLIRKIERDELLEELLKNYFKENA